MKGANRKYFNGQGIITKLEATLKYPDPAFFDRPDDKMSHDELREMLGRNVEEIRHLLNAFFEPYANGRIIGRPTKAHLRERINTLHDWRVSQKIMGGERGRPYLWEE
jgi:hypothetical protein